MEPGVGPPAVDRQAAPLFLRPSRYQRGPNHRLLLPPARVIKRKAVAGRVFGEPVLGRRTGGVAGNLTLNEHSFSAIEAEHDPESVLRFVASSASVLVVPLDRGRSARVEVDRVIGRGDHTHTLVGRVAGDPFSDVLLVFHDGAVSGSVAFHDRNEHFDFGSAGNGDVAIRRLDPTSFDAPCGNPGDEACDPADETGAPAGGGEGDEEADPEASVVMDSVVGYGEQARITEGGVAAIEAKIIASVDRMNTAFSNSLIADTAVELLATIEDPDYVFPGGTSGVMGSADELGDLDNTSDGALDTVTDLRILLGADQAAFVIKQADGSAGIAYRPGRSMIVARNYMTSVRITFAHEFGHNIGAHHAWGDSSTSFGTSAHNYGWRFDPPGAAVATRTIMAYDWNWGDGDRVPYFSNPAVSYNGANTGAVDGYDATGDSTADPRSVSGGYTGSAGSGYDGTHANLGARNADYIELEAPDLADNATRAIIPPEIAVEDPAANELADGAGTVEIVSNGVGLPVAVTFTIRNLGIETLTGVSVSKSGTDSGGFSIVQPATSVEQDGSTTFDVTFTPGFAGEHLATLHIASNDADENPFDIDLRGVVSSELTFSDSVGFSIPSSGNATPYPGTIEISGVGATLLSFKVRLEGVSHSWPSDLDILLLAPSGQVCALMSDCGDGDEITDVELVFSDAAASSVPEGSQISSGEYLPTNSSTAGESLPPGGSGSIGTSLAALTSDGVNGIWSLFVDDDYSGDTGSIDGWSILLEAEAPDPFVAWLGAAGLAGGDAEADAVPFDDDVPNLLKFAFGLAGSGPDHRALVAQTGDSGLPVAWRDGTDGSCVFEYVRRTDGSVTYEPLEAPSPGGLWSAATGTTTVAAIDSDWERVQIRYAAGSGPVFFSVRVTLP